jgi:hypothetical protein
LAEAEREKRVAKPEGHKDTKPERKLIVRCTYESLFINICTPNAQRARRGHGILYRI